MTLSQRFLLIVVAFAIVPLAATAQVLPAIAAAGLPAIGVHSRLAAWHVTASRPSRAPVRQHAPVLNVKVPETGLAQEFDLRPKANWSDDQGFRISPSRVAFKSRF